MVLTKVQKAVEHPARAYEHLSKIPFKFVDEYMNYGTNVFEREWDLLIILDACRYDLFAEFCPQHSVHELLDSTEYIYSIASKTPDWIQRTFEDVDDSLLSRTAFIGGNGFIKEFEPEQVDVEHAWQHLRHPEAHITPPEIVTNEAIRKFRNTEMDRYIAHYVQPHAPFLHCIGKYNSVNDVAGKPNNVWKGLRDGKFDKNEVWKDYGQNLLLVLDHVETLIENFDGKVAITADHANAMGEFGLYGHPGKEAAPSIRRVPWAVASGQGLHDYEVKPRDEVKPEDYTHDTSPDLQQHLRDLGYRV